MEDTGRRTGEAIAAWIQERGIVDLDASHWAAAALQQAVEGGAIDLPADGRLRPDSPLTFYQAAAAVLTWQQQPIQDQTPAEVARQAVALKLMPGPVPEADRNLTRLEAAYMAGVMLGFDGTVEQAVGLDSLFTDWSLIPADMRDEVYFVTVENRLFVGFPDRTFQPDGAFTLAQYAVMVERFRDIRAKPSVPLLGGP